MRWPPLCRRRPEAMTAHAFITGISGDRQIAGTLAIAAPGALYAVDFSTPDPKNPEPELLPPSARDCVAGKRIDEERRPRDDHQQPPRQIHLSRTEICPKQRSHPSIRLSSLETPLIEELSDRIVSGVFAYVARPKCRPPPSLASCRRARRSEFVPGQLLAQVLSGRPPIQLL